MGHWRRKNGNKGENYLRKRYMEGDLSSIRRNDPEAKKSSLGALWANSFKWEKYSRKGLPFAQDYGTLGGGACVWLRTAEMNIRN